MPPDWVSPVAAPAFQPIVLWSGINKRPDKLLGDRRSICDEHRPITPKSSGKWVCFPSSAERLWGRGGRERGGVGGGPIRRRRGEVDGELQDRDGPPAARSVQKRKKERKKKEGSRPRRDE